jgi:hypothetical protein
MSRHPSDALPEHPAEPAPVEVQRAQADRLLQAWKTPEGWRYWSAVNNQEIGKWYTATAFAFMLFGGVLAI